MVTNCDWNGNYTLYSFESYLILLNGMEQKLQNYANTRLVYKLDIFDQPQLIVDVGVGYRQCLKLIQNTQRNLWAKLAELQGLNKFTKFYEFQAYQYTICK